MSMLVIRRADTPRQDLALDYRVLVDGKQRAALGNDSTVQVPVTPGEHVVRVAVRWCSSGDRVFDIAHGQIVRMECRPKVSPLFALLYVTIWRNRYISLNTVDN